MSLLISLPFLFFLIIPPFYFSKYFSSISHLVFSSMSSPPYFCFIITIPFLCFLSITCPTYFLIPSISPTLPFYCAIFFTISYPFITSLFCSNLFFSFPFLIPFISIDFSYFFLFPFTISRISIISLFSFCILLPVFLLNHSFLIPGFSFSLLFVFLSLTSLMLSSFAYTFSPFILIYLFFLSEMSAWHPKSLLSIFALPFSLFITLSALITSLCYVRFCFQAFST